MSQYVGSPDYAHDSTARLGVLITNLGTPDAPTAGALRRYLAEFLSDPRVVETPRWLWWLVLHGIILRIRPRRAAAAYAKVWSEEGSPLLVYSRRQARALQSALDERFPGRVRVALAMRYGTPSVASALEELRQANAQRIVVLPLYPQYSATTTASTFDAVADVLKRWRWLPQLRFVTQYHDDPGYIAALAESIRAHRTQHGAADRLLFSFHGLPKRYLLQGDPYFCQCHKTARLVAEHLELSDQDWQVVFQSRFGREEWLKPYADHTLAQLPKEGITSV
ncbi:MAG: ferrochelatase, partial [Thiotrichales bacterium SG8_50]